jgi:hypothetical protein
MAKSFSIDRLIQTTRQQWKASDSSADSITLGSATQPLIVSLHSAALCGLQSGHDFTGMGDWRTSDDNSDDTLMAAA